jgi:hypothetical protein
MTSAVEALYKLLIAPITSCLLEHPGYRFHITGHSLGAAAAALLALKLLVSHRDIFPPVKVLCCYCFAPPSVVSRELSQRPEHREVITSVAMNYDVVPRFSLHSPFPPPAALRCH